MTKKVLLLFDEDENSKSLKKYLLQFGFTVAMCERLEYAVEKAAKDRPDLIIANSIHPVFSGYEIIRIFKTTRSVAPIPFFLMCYQKTTSKNRFPESMRYKPDEYISIPLDPRDLYLKAARWLGLTPNSAILSEIDAAPSPGLPEREDKIDAVTMYRGRVNAFDIARALFLIGSSGAEFHLRVKSTRRKMKVVVRNGLIVNVVSNYIHEESLGRALVKRGFITTEENETSFRHAEKMKMQHGDMLVKMGILTKRELGSAIAQQKEYKLFALLTSSWEGAEYEARREDAECDEELPLDLPVMDFLRRAILEKPFEVELAEGYFMKKKGAGVPFFFKSRVKELEESLHLRKEHRNMILQLEGRTLEEIRADSTVDFKMAQRLLFLLEVVEAVEFERNGGPSRAGMGTPGDVREQSSAAAGSDEQDHGLEGVIQDFFQLIGEARELMAEEKFHAAIPLLRKACAVNEQSSAAIALLAWAQFNIGRRNDPEETGAVKELLKKALAMDEQNELAHLYLGKILKEEHQQQSAVMHFKTALRINPDNEEARREVTLAEIKLRQKREQGFRL
jgi:CheY-like chemotaxis protein